MSFSLTHIAAVAAGGALGALGRYGVGIVIGRWLGHGFPWATLMVNILGSLAMGILIGIFAHYGTGNGMRLFLVVGFLGAFTTFSTFSLDAVSLFERGEHMAVMIYLAGSVIGAIAGLFLGLTLIRSMVAS